MEIKAYTRKADKRALLEAAAKFYAQELKLTNSRYNLTIHTIPGLAKDGKMNGCLSKIADNELMMLLDSRLGLEQMFLTIAHEMVHAKQHAKGQLKICQRRNGSFYWKWLGRRYNTEYFDCPWEIEAFSRERLLTNKITKILLKGKVVVK